MPARSSPVDASKMDLSSPSPRLLDDEDAELFTAPLLLLLPFAVLALVDATDMFVGVRADQLHDAAQEPFPLLRAT